ncbi:hypothetical protein HK097_009714 [Rhizophlyctis rosea]|uniref:BTB domain-containing protein n=1 Tax=Rhizophlyctis rosea TaxID=64517 RepID=A0AAD5S8J0_9FUNG|nr:hypothetical protein HK097_009714 [Rhizophlyctis rosea]
MLAQIQPARQPSTTPLAGDRHSFGLYLTLVQPAKIPVDESVTVRYDFFIKITKGGPYITWHSSTGAKSLQYWHLGCGWSELIARAWFAETESLPKELGVGVVLYPRPTGNACACRAPLFLCSPSGSEFRFASLEYDASLDLLQSGKHADFTFRIGNERIRAHSPIILSRAPDTALSNMLSLPMREQSVREANLKDVSVKTFRTLLEFIYTGHCHMADNITSSLELYRAADRFQVVRCAQWAKLELVRHLTEVKTSELYWKSHIFEQFHDQQTPDATIFKILCVQGLLRNWESFIRGDLWEKLPKSVLQEMLKVIAKYAGVLYKPKE